MKGTLKRLFMMGRKHADIPLVNVVKLQGVIAASTAPPSSPAARRIISADKVEKWFKRAFDTSLKPAAVAVTINSPGGSPVQSGLVYDIIRHHAKRTKIPVYTFAEDVAASGGYYLLCAGDNMYAHETSLVGSIGVIFGGFGFVDVMKKLGVERRVYTAGKSKSFMDPFKPMTEDEEKLVQNLLDSVHDGFKGVVKGARGDKLKLSDEEAFSGRVWSGAQAVEYGLTDGVATMKALMREQFGPKVHFSNCTPAATPLLSDLLGMTWRPTSTSLGPASHYHITQQALQAAMDEMEYRAMWSRFGIH